MAQLPKFIGQSDSLPNLISACLLFSLSESVSPIALFFLKLHHPFILLRLSSLYNFPFCLLLGHSDVPNFTVDLMSFPQVRNLLLPSKIYSLLLNDWLLPWFWLLILVTSSCLSIAPLSLLCFTFGPVSLTSSFIFLYCGALGHPSTFCESPTSKPHDWGHFYIPPMSPLQPDNPILP